MTFLTFCGFSRAPWSCVEFCLFFALKKMAILGTVLLSLFGKSDKKGPFLGVLMERAEFPGNSKDRLCIREFSTFWPTFYLLHD